jgi:hypothetical protein
MSEKDHLFALIHSLKNTEKSYFKKIKTAFGNTDSSLLQLFDAIQKIDTYDEANIMKSLGKESYREFISAKKYVLFNEILDILTYMKSKTEEGIWQINRLVGHALVLKEKMLYEEALKILHKAQKIAIENDFFSKQLEINQQCIEVLHQQSAMLDFNYMEQIENHRLNVIKISEFIINTEQFFILSDKLFRKGEMLRHSSNESLKMEMQELYAYPLLSDANKALTKTAKICYHFILYYKYHSFEIDLKKACFHLKELIHEQAQVKRFSARSRIVQMNNFIQLAMKCGLKNEAFEMLEQMKKMYEEENDPFLILNYLVSGGIFYAMNSDSEGYRNFHQKIDEGVASLIDKSNFSKELLDVKHQQFCFYFEQKEFKKAYQIANFIDGQYDLRSYKNTRITEKILKLLCAYEMEEDELVRAEIRAIKYLQKGVDDMLAADVAVFNLLERLAKANTKEAAKISMQQYLQNTENIEHEGKYSFLIDGFGFNLWVKSKVNKESFFNLKFNQIVDVLK